MRIEAKTDQAGNVVGYITIDDEGNVIDDFNRGQGPIAGSSSGSSAPIPQGISLPGRPTSGGRGSGSEGELGDDGYIIPPGAGNNTGDPNADPQDPQGRSRGGNGLSDGERRIGSQRDRRRGVEVEEGSRIRELNERRQAELRDDVREGNGPLRGLGARANLGFRNFAYGLMDAADDVGDFAATVIDTARRVETNNDDNWFNPVGRLAKPETALGNFGSEVVSFGVTALGVGAAAAAAGAVGIPVVGALALGRAGWQATVATGATTGFITDFIKAKEGETNLYNAVEGTPLETPISRYFAADTSEDANQWLNKIREGVGGVPLGIAFDLVGPAAKKAAGLFKREPLETLVTGIRDIKALPPARQNQAMSELYARVDEVTEQTRTVLVNEIKKEADAAITRADRLLTGKDFRVDDAGLINSDLDAFTVADAMKRQEQGSIDMEIEYPRERDGFIDMEIEYPRERDGFIDMEIEYPRERDGYIDIEIEYLKDYDRGLSTNTVTEEIEEHIEHLTEYRESLREIGTVTDITEQVDRIDQSILNMQQSLSEPAKLPEPAINAGADADANTIPFEPFTPKETPDGFIEVRGFEGYAPGTYDEGFSNYMKTTTQWENVYENVLRVARQDGNETVTIERFREMLPGLSRAEQDSYLFRLETEGKVKLGTDGGDSANGIARDDGSFTSEMEILDARDMLASDKPPVTAAPMQRPTEAAQVPEEALAPEATPQAPEAPEAVPAASSEAIAKLDKDIREQQKTLDAYREELEEVADDEKLGVSVLISKEEKKLDVLKLKRSQLNPEAPAAPAAPEVPAKVSADSVQPSEAFETKKAHKNPIIDAILKVDATNGDNNFVDIAALKEHKQFASMDDAQINQVLGALDKQGLIEISDNHVVVKGVKEGHSAALINVKAVGDTEPVFRVLLEEMREYGRDLMPIGKLRDRIPQLSRAEQDSYFYKMQREGKIELIALHDQGKYSKAEMYKGIRQDNGGYLFFAKLEDESLLTKAADAPTAPKAPAESAKAPTVSVEPNDPPFIKAIIQTDIDNGGKNMVPYEALKKHPQFSFLIDEELNILLNSLEERGLATLTRNADGTIKDVSVIRGSSSAPTSPVEAPASIPEASAIPDAPEAVPGAPRANEVGPVDIREGSTYRSNQVGSAGGNTQEQMLNPGELGMGLPTPERAPNPYSRPVRSRAEVRAEIARKRVAKRLAENNRAYQRTVDEAKRYAEMNNPVVGAKTEVSTPYPQKAADAKLRADLKREKAAAKLIKPNAPSKGRPISTARYIDAEKMRSVMSKDNVDTSSHWVNIDRLNLTEDSEKLMGEVMASIPDKNIVDSMTEEQSTLYARQFANQIKKLPDDDMFLAAVAYADNLGTVGIAQQAVRMTVRDMAGQVETLSKSIPVGKPLSQLTTTEHQSYLEMLRAFSVLTNFSTLNKNIGKLLGQGLSLRKADISEGAVKRAMSKVKYDELMAGAKKGTPNTNEMYERLVEAMKTPEGRKKIDRLATSVKASSTPEEAWDNMQVGMWDILKNRLGTGEKFAQSVRMAGILSGTRSQTINIVANLTSTFYVPTTQIAGAALDAGWNTLTRNAEGLTKDKEVMLQSTAQMASVFSYVRDSIKMAVATLKTGTSVLKDAKGADIADATDRFDILADQGNKLTNMAFGVLNAPLRLLATNDEIFSQMNYRAFVHGKAVVEGTQKGYKGKALKHYVAEMVDLSLGVNENGMKGIGLDPEGIQYAEYTTFQTRVKQDESYLRYNIVKSLKEINQGPLGPVSKFFIPFITTPANIMAYSARNTPLAGVSKQWRGDIAAGGIRKSRALGEFALGSTALMGVTSLAMQGRLTGSGPADPKRRALWLAEGNQPYSVILPGGKKMVSFQRFEPFATHFAMVADLAQTMDGMGPEHEREFAKTFSAITLSFVESTKNRAFFEGISQLIELVDALGPDAYLSDDGDSRKTNTVEYAVSKMVNSMIPYSSLLNEQRQAKDTYLRETQGIVDSFKNRIPGWSEELPAKRFWLTGEPIPYQSNPVLNIYPSAALQNDPLIAKLLKHNVAITPPSKNIKGVKLSTDQYSTLLELTGKTKIGGKTLYEALSDTFAEYDEDILDSELAYIQSVDDYANARPVAKALRKVRTRYKEAAEAAMVRQYPDLYEAVKSKVIEEDNVGEMLFFDNVPLGGYTTPPVESGNPILDDRRATSREKTNDTLDDLVNGAGQPSEAE